MVMQYDDLQKCMEQIAADSTMRMQMMSMMMTKCQNDKEGMMQICNKMMDNPEMHKMMMKRMEAKGMMKHDMNYDSTNTMKK